MTNLVETIAKALVDNPDQVIVTESSDRHGELVQLQVAGDDMGKVIGKKGRIAKALRTVVKAAATKQKKTITVEIVSEDELASAEIYEAEEVAEETSADMAGAADNAAD